jgi:hypothetical protein
MICDHSNASRTGKTVLLPMQHAPLIGEAPLTKIA